MQCGSDVDIGGVNYKSGCCAFLTAQDCLDYEVGKATKLEACETPVNNSES